LISVLCTLHPGKPSVRAHDTSGVGKRR
jgi:hypothetical protein